jgi:hypothetical protein
MLVHPEISDDILWDIAMDIKLDAETFERAYARAYKLFRILQQKETGAMLDNLKYVAVCKNDAQEYVHSEPEGDSTFIESGEDGE